MRSIFAFEDSICFIAILVALLLQDVERAAHAEGFPLAPAQVCIDSSFAPAD
jgi:hypothetical protein